MPPFLGAPEKSGTGICLEALSESTDMGGTTQRKHRSCRSSSSDAWVLMSDTHKKKLAMEVHLALEAMFLYKPLAPMGPLWE